MRPGMLLRANRASIGQALFVSVRTLVAGATAHVVCLIDTAHAALVCQASHVRGPALASFPSPNSLRESHHQSTFT